MPRAMYSLKFVICYWTIERLQQFPAAKNSARSLAASKGEKIKAAHYINVVNKVWQEGWTSPFQRLPWKAIQCCLISQFSIGKIMVWRSWNFLKEMSKLHFSNGIDMPFLESRMVSLLTMRTARSEVARKDYKVNVIYFTLFLARPYLSWGPALFPLVRASEMMVSATVEQGVCTIQNHCKKKGTSGALF